MASSSARLAPGAGPGTRASSTSAVGGRPAQHRVEDGVVANVGVGAAEPALQLGLGEVGLRLGRRASRRRGGGRAQMSRWRSGMRS